MGDPLKNGGFKITVAKRSVASDYGNITQDGFLVTFSS